MAHDLGVRGRTAPPNQSTSAGRSLAILLESLRAVEPIALLLQAQLLEGLGILGIASFVLSAKLLTALAASQQRSGSSNQRNAFHSGQRIWACDLKTNKPKALAQLVHMHYH